MVEYAATVWDPYMDINIRKIKMVQRRAARFVARNYNRTASVGVLLHQLGRKSFQSKTKAMRLHVEQVAPRPSGSRLNAAVNPNATG